MRTSVILFAVLCLAGCAGGIYQPFYPIADPNPSTHLELLKPGEEPKLYSSEDMDLDNLILISRHYRPIGYMMFGGKFDEDDNIVLAQAKLKGATVVLLNPLLWNKNKSYPSIYHSATTSYYSDVIKSRRLQNERAFYDQSARFFVKTSDKFKVGVALTDLTEAQKRALGRNTGAFINVIMEDTPAFSSGLLPGDVLIKINEEQVTGIKQSLDIFQKIDPLAKGVVFTVIRDGKEHVFTVKLD
ncbi:MAG: PDZ domain-containing protein [Sideroxyarcus sp.]